MSMPPEVSFSDFSRKFINGDEKFTQPEKKQCLRDLQIMIANLKNIPREQVLFSPDDLYLTHDELVIFNDMIARYINDEPVSKIIHQRFFWKHAFYVDENVLDPRPETELIIELMLKQFATYLPLRFLDMGTGSGCILLSLLQEYENATGIGIDICPGAIAVAKRNRKMFPSSIAERAEFIIIDWNDLGKTQAAAHESHFHSFDVLVGNPPYIKSAEIEFLPKNVKNYDPRVALDGGQNGMTSFAEIASIAKKMLRPNGRIFLEIGIDQDADVKKILQHNNFSSLNLFKDSNEIDRVISGTYISF
ncbi:MAG: peptide chain release factor N(5)-glutamine methyltransferase [Holosporaceae bacterium]|jgi:release factor glutamine methyltransferase|nr:peptide chain release factor N(5)-glutamine methyltransferase [Holosporaceae bacterium]